MKFSIITNTLRKYHIRVLSFCFLTILLIGVNHYYNNINTKDNTYSISNIAVTKLQDKNLKSKNNNIKSTNTASMVVANCTGNADNFVNSSIGITNGSNATGGANGTFAQVYDLGDRLILDLTDTIIEGEFYDVVWRRKNTYTNTATADMIIEESIDGNNWTTNPVEPTTTSVNNFITSSVAAATATRYLRISTKTASNDDLDFDAVAYSNVLCNPVENNICIGADFVAEAIQATCDNSTTNNDAQLQITSLNRGDRVSYSIGSSFTGDTDYANATIIGSLPYTFASGLPDPDFGQDYTVRVFDGASDCFTDQTIKLAKSCIPGDLPWNSGECGILVPGIAVATCGVSTAVPTNERWTVGMININGAVPASGRVDVSDNQAMYHHPSWLISEIGNVFGTAINSKTGNVYVAASSNFGAGFLGRQAVMQYGNLGGGANSLAAAGTVYQLDALTGQATVFAQLPQQSSSFTNIDCEGTSTISRPNTGPALGNIVFDAEHDQYFVSNIEDGRIYRLDLNGAILDSYDPLNYDNGAAGISDLEDLVYGLAVNDTGTRLYFGTVSAPSGGNETAGAGTPAIYSIDITATGAFSGTVDNSFLHTGATYNNYVGTELFHTVVNCGDANGFSYTDNTVFLISDLEFTPDGNLLVGVRVSCNNTFFSSYNHWAETDLITPNGSGIYNNSITQFDISVQGQAGPDDSYGGVAAYEFQDGSGDVYYMASSADILEEVGPHGIAVWNSTTTSAPVSPLGAISYGTVDVSDPKGVGGDIEVFSECVCDEPLFTLGSTPNSCTNNELNNATIDVTNISTEGKRIGISTAGATIYDGDNYLDATILSGNSHTLSNLAHSSAYIVRIYNNSNYCYTELTITTAAPFTPPTVSVSDQTDCEDANVIFTANANSGEGNSLSYQWQDNSSGSFANLVGETNATLNLNNITAAMHNRQYRIVVTESTTNCTEIATATLTVNNLPTINIVSKTCQFGLPTTYTVELTTNGNTLSSSHGNVTNNGGGSYTISNITNGQDITVTSTNTTTTCQRQEIITAPSCTCPSINPPTSDGDQEICADDAIPTLSVSVDAGQTADWYDANINGILLASGTTTYTPVSAGTFYAEARNTTTQCTSDNRTAVSLTIYNNPVVSLNNEVACAGETVIFTANASNGEGNGLTYQWQDNSSGSFANINGETAATLTLTGVTIAMNNRQYRVLVTENTTNCTDQATATLTVTQIQYTIITNCFDNDTGGDNSDDYYTVDITVNNVNGGASNQYEIVSGGQVIATGTYNNNVLLEWRDQNNTQRFFADNVTTYDLVIRDLDSNSCAENVTIMAQPSCSSCPPQPICLPINITKNFGL